MGDEAERDRRLADHGPYQVNPADGARGTDAVFLHCLPAHRGQEVAAAVIDGPQSAVCEQAANRLPTEQARDLTPLVSGDWAGLAMRVVVALGGNALLRRGEPLDAAAQRRNVISGGRGAGRAGGRARGGRHSRQRPPGRAARPPGRGLPAGPAVPARRARRRDRGNDRLPARAGARQRPRAATGGDAAHAGDRRPGRSRVRAIRRSSIGPVYDRPTRGGSPPSADGRGAATALTGDGSCRRPSRARSSSSLTIRLLVEAGVLVVCVGGGGIPVIVDRDGDLRGVEAVIDKDLAASLLAARSRRGRAAAAHRRRRRPA